jgi:hypothetical protein
MAYIGNPSGMGWFGEDTLSLGFGEPAGAPKCAAAELDVFLLDAILRRLNKQPGSTKLRDLLRKAVDSTVQALPSFVGQGCCEPHLKALETDVSALPWPASQQAQRKRLLDAIRATQQVAKKDFQHC